jgi:hypothetical protein
MRRVRPGDEITIAAADYNRLLDAAEAHARDRLPGGKQRPAPVHRDAGLVRIQNKTASAVPMGGVLAISGPVADPETNAEAAARFVREFAALGVAPTVDDHVGQIAVTIEPIAADAVGRAVIDGIAAARVNVIESWHTFADLGAGVTAALRSAPTGSADILWRRNPNDTGEQWAVVRIGNTTPTAWLIQPPAAGVPGMVDLSPGFAPSCPLYRITSSGSAERVQTPTGTDVSVPVLNLSPQRIAAPPTVDRLQLVPVQHDARTGRWLARPPRQTIVAVPLGRVHAGAFGSCRVRRWNGTAWIDSAEVVPVLNACGFAWRRSDTVLGNWHDDAGYVGQACKCCDDSGSS